MLPIKRILIIFVIYFISILLKEIFSNYDLLKKRKIVIVGCGNVGSRHLQAIAKLPYDLTIEVVEKRKEAKELAVKRLNEINFDKNMIKCFWYNDIEELDGKADLIIVSTQSPGKVDLVSKLLDMGYSKFLIDKIIAQSEKQYNFLLEKFLSLNAKAWVNTARVCFDSYIKIKDYFSKSGPLHMTINCGNEGLGCNAIHFLNLFSFFCNDYKIKLNGGLLYDKILPNNRGKNLMEFAGTITGLLKDGSTITVTFSPHENLAFTIGFQGNNKQIFIDETLEKLYHLKGEKPLDIEFKDELQSTLTTKIVLDILEKDTCNLPTLKDSSYVHFELFRIFNEHIKKILDKEMELCPIT